MILAAPLATEARPISVRARSIMIAVIMPRARIGRNTRDRPGIISPQVRHLRDNAMGLKHVGIGR